MRLFVVISFMLLCVFLAAWNVVLASWWMVAYFAGLACVFAYLAAEGNQ